MGILFISTNDWIPWGGSEVLWSQAALMISRSQGMRVGVNVQKWRPQPAHIRELELAGAKIIYKNRKLSFPKKILNRIAPALFKFSSRKNAKLFNPSNWNLVVFSLGNHNSSSELIEECRKSQIPYVLIVQLVQSASVPHDRMLAEQIKRNYTLAKKVYFVSKQNQNILETQLADSLNNAEVISNPFPISKNEVKYPATDKGFKLAFVASLRSNHKGHDLLFEVLSQKKWKDRELFINIYGDGPHEYYIKELKRFHNLSKVSIVGFSFAKHKIWEENHGLILCSRMEGQSLALLEAMSFNRMAIVTDVGDAHLLIEENETGFVAESPSTKHIDKALELAWERRYQWEEMGNRAGAKLRQMRPADPVEIFSKKLLKDIGT